MHGLNDHFLDKPGSASSCLYILTRVSGAVYGLDVLLIPTSRRNILHFTFSATISPEGKGHQRAPFGISCATPVPHTVHRWA